MVLGLGGAVTFMEYILSNNIDLYDYWEFVGMAFKTMEDFEKFYKAYAHNVGFSIGIEQKRVVDNVVV